MCHLQILKNILPKTGQIEAELKTRLPYSDVFIHVEPINDPDAFDDCL
jgi:hypothetical protein